MSVGASRPVHHFLCVVANSLTRRNNQGSREHDRGIPQRGRETLPSFLAPATRALRFPVMTSCAVRLRGV